MNGEAFRREVAKATASRHRQQRNSHGRRPQGVARIDTARVGYRVKPDAQLPAEPVGTSAPCPGLSVQPTKDMVVTAENGIESGTRNGGDDAANGDSR